MIWCYNESILDEGISIMTMPQLTPAYDEFLDYLVSRASAQDILAFKPSAQAQERADYLTEKNKDDLLTLEEKLELEQLMEFDSLVSVLKARALASLKS